MIIKLNLTVSVSIVSSVTFEMSSVCLLKQDIFYAIQVLK